MNQQTAAAPVTEYETKYGFVKITGHQRVDNTGCVQVNEWTSKRTGETETEHIHCDGTNDFSRHDEIKYNSKCYFCYAGVGHTRNRHNKDVAK